MSEGFRTFDHTADLGLEVWAATPERLYALAAEALLAQAIEAPDGEPELEVEIDLEGDDPRDLMVHWLNTALLEADLRRAVWTRAVVERLTPTSISGRLEGVPRDPARQIFLRELKAVSHHALELVLEPPACRCRLVLDI